MASFSNILTKIDINNLITVFNVQIALAIFLVFFLFRNLISQIVIKLIFTVLKRDKKVKESSSYKTLSTFLIFLGVYLALRILRLSKQAIANIDTIFEVICIIFVTNIITLNITKDTKYIKRSKSDVVNNFICRIVKVVIWIIAIYIVLLRVGVNLTGLVAGFGIRQCYNFTSCPRCCKKFAKWCSYYD